ncbi:uncharacterized protein ARMOST_19092 [Armillaria ostoyae]|uniref:Dolichol phosphate-mannose biosynthesis regulatory protein n=1 Tax=Armillaria ostoyae TaxID=47428 RepID=A0A284S3K5_ARMOS|nr:uncharacterized protein ARMOST_19092 [Armillaria ostoyae]
MKKQRSPVPSVVVVNYPILYHTFSTTNLNKTYKLYHENLVPFDIPVASAITFVGLIYLLILSFFIVMIVVSAREVSGLQDK